MKINRLDGLAGVWQTVYIMKNLADNSIYNKEIKDYISKLVMNIPPSNEYDRAKIIFEFIRSRMKYVKDIHGVEEIQTPEKIFKDMLSNMAHGDCDDMALISSVLYKMIGIPVRYSVMAIGNSYNYNHVRSEIQIQGRWIPVELASTKPFGEGYLSNIPELYLYI